MSGHTPGPWVVRTEPDYSIHRTRNVYVCRSDEPWPDSQLARVNTADEYGSQLANARLIAAAPELLGIVQQMLEAIASGHIDSPELGEPEVGIPMHKWHEEWEHYARAAILKAEAQQ